MKNLNNSKKALEKLKPLSSKDLIFPEPKDPVLRYLAYWSVVREREIWGDLVGHKNAE